MAAFLKIFGGMYNNKKMSSKRNLSCVSKTEAINSVLLILQKLEL